ncbi:MAG: hypothetical protein J3K34DRAFT_517324 [Monoraphidium minutum]|nr:MAG: hypothetical protein J3K34DRAFT_517324 [Monoraphidium minutum]
MGLFNFGSNMNMMGNKGHKASLNDLSADKTAPVLAKNAARQGAAPRAAQPWERGTGTRAIRSKLLARATKLGPQDKKSSRWALGAWLGGAGPRAAAPAPPRAAGVEAHEDETDVLYMDDLGHVHLGVHAGDDRELFSEMRKMKAEEHQAAARAAARRAPAVAAQRRAAAAAGRRAPAAPRPFSSGAAKRRATHALFQPRRQN